MEVDAVKDRKRSRFEAFFSTPPESPVYRVDLAQGAAAVNVAVEEEDDDVELVAIYHRVVWTVFDDSDSE